MTTRAADLETGDLSQFDTVVTDAGDLSVETAAAAHGGYGLQALIDDTNELRADLNISADELWLRAYFKMDSGYVGVSGQLHDILRLVGSGWFASLWLRYDSSSGFRLGATRPKNGTHAVINSAYWKTLTKGRWYCLEMHFKRASGGGATDGEFHIWVDGVQQYAETVDNNPPATGPSSSGRVHIRSIESGVGGKLYFDDVVVSDQRRVYPVRGGFAAQVNRALGSFLGRETA